jgi:predicted metal-dependent peptidase
MSKKKEEEKSALSAGAQTSKFNKSLDKQSSVDKKAQIPKLSKKEHKVLLEKIGIAKTGILNKKQEYGYFVSNSRLIPSYKVPTMGVTLLSSGLTIFYNPVWSSKLSTLQVAGVLLHEYDHALMDHMRRAKNFKGWKVNHELHNICMDLIINQNNNWLPDGCVTLESIKKQTGLDLPAFESYEFYFHKIKNKLEKEQKSQSGKGSGSGNGAPQRGKNADVHDMEAIEQAIREAGLEGEQLSDSEKQAMARSIAKGVRESGKAPGHLEGFIDELLESTINWKRELRHWVGRETDNFAKPTRMRRNRRYGIREPGKRKKTNLPKVGVLIDSSGSVHDELYAAFIGELNGMHKQGYEIYYVISDTEVKFEGKFELEKLKSRKGYGGTYHEPGLERLDKLGMDLIIGFSDGDPTGDTYVTKAPMVWVLSRDTEPPTECKKCIVMQNA